MPVFPNAALSWQNDTNDRDIISFMQDCWDQHSSANLNFQFQANVDVRFYVGDQRIWNDMYGQDLPFNRRNFNFNLLRRIVEMPAGYQRQNRKSITAIPVEGSDQVTADQFTKILMWIEQSESLDETISSAFTSALITGASFLEIWQDYTRDPLSGQTRVDSVPYNAVIFDSFFKKQDMSDCDFFWKRSFVTPTQLSLLLPAYKDHLQDLGVASGRNAGNGLSDGKFSYMPESIFFNEKVKQVIYDEFSYRSSRPAIFLYEEDTGKQIEWVGTKDDMREFIQEVFQTNGTSLKVMNAEVDTVKQGAVVNGHVVYNGGNTLGLDSYNFIPVLGYYTAESDSLDYRLQGMIRSLRDSQYLFNRTTVNMLDIVESQPNSGFIATEDSVVNPKSLFKTGQGQVIWRKKGSTPEDIQKIPPGAMAPGLFELADKMSKLPQDISGVSEELLGSAQDDIPGIRSMLKQGAGLITLRRLFDQLDTSMKLLGRKLLKVIQNEYTPGKVERIINEKPSPEFYNRDFGVYDAAIEEGFNTTTQKQLAFAQALQLKEIIPNFPGSFLIKNSTIQNKDEIIQALQTIEEQEQISQQMQSEGAQKEQEATIAMAEGQANYSNAGAEEKMSKIDENAAQAEERRAQADKDQEQALLNKIKALKEIEDIDISHLERLITIARSLETESKTP